jgi:hypothetical protein
MGAVALLAYVFTLYPDVTGGDAGELITRVVSGGVIHPPGFPLYALLSGLFTHLPVATIAWRFNLFSAGCDAMAASLLTAAVSRWTGRVGAGVAAAALFAFSPVVWLHAISAEVFALNNLLVALLLLLAVLYAEHKDWRFALAGALVSGLGLANHQMIVFVVGPLALWSLVVGWSELIRPKRLAMVAGAFGLGLTPYLYLPFAPGRNGMLSWGEPDSWSGFWTHVLRREYGTFNLATPVEGPLAGAGLVAEWGQHLVSGIGPWGAVLAALGLLLVLPTKWSLTHRAGGSRFALVLIAAPALTLGVFATLGNIPASEILAKATVDRFWQQVDLFICVFAGVALVELADRTRPWVLLPVAVMLAVIQLAGHASVMNRRGSNSVHEMAAEILRVAPPDSLILAEGDTVTNALEYLQLVEHKSTDVRVVNADLLAAPWYPARVRARYPQLSVPDSVHSMKDLLDANTKQFQVLSCGNLGPGDADVNAAYERWPIGFCDLLVPAGAPMDVPFWLSRAEESLPHVDFSRAPRLPGSWEDGMWRAFWAARQALALQYLTLAMRDPDHREQARRAVEIFEDMRDHGPEQRPELFKALAVALEQAGVETAAEREKVIDAWHRYLRLASKDDPDREMAERDLRVLVDEAP